MTESLWPALLVNFLFWPGVAIGVPVFFAILELSDAEWADPVRDLAGRFCRFLPLMFIVYLAIFGAAGTIRARDVVALAAAFGAAFWFGRGRFRSPAAAIALLIVYAAAFSIIAVDVIMSLEPDWIGTLFPAYMLTTNVYAGIAALTVAGAIGLPAKLFTRAVMRDLGGLLLGFAFIWIYFTWAQFFVIWYGNLPSETRFIAERISGGWQWLAWAVAGACGALPAIVLMPQLGRQRIPLAIVGATILVGYWVECWLLVRPALPAASTVAATVAVTAAFGLLFAACIALPRRPLSPAAPLPHAEPHAVRAHR